MIKLRFRTIFAFILLLKIFLALWFSIEQMQDYFIPFLDNAVQNPLSNPWILTEKHHFPYGLPLFLILFIPKLVLFQLFGDTALGSQWMSLLAMKLPLFAMDLLVFYVLKKLCPKKTEAILVLWWCNPAAIYINYVLGQFDIVPTALSIASCLLLIEKKWFISAIYLALACSCKFNAFVLVPWFLVYIWNQNFKSEALQKISIFLTTIVSFTLVSYFPLIYLGRFEESNFGSPEFSRLFSMNIHLGQGNYFFVGIALLFLAISRLCIATRISPMGFLFGSGYIMGVLILATKTAPAWYIWFMPFTVLFFTHYPLVPKSIFSVFLFLYLLSFVFVRSFFTEDSLFFNIGFTALQTSLAGILVAFEFVTLSKNAPVRGRLNFLKIGLSGDSGSGKNTLCHTLSETFSSSLTTVIEGDDYHKWERGNERWQDYTHLNPRANFLHEMAQHTLALQQGGVIYKEHYDHKTGMHTPRREVKPGRVLLVQGLHALYLKTLRDNFDLKIFLNPRPEVRLAWKLQRDVQERGHSKEKVIQSFKSRIMDAEKHILPQIQYADWIIESYFINETKEEDILEGKVDKEIGVKHHVWNNISWDDVVERLMQVETLKIRVGICEDNFDRQTMDVFGAISSAKIEKITSECFPNLRQLIRSRQEPIFKSNYEGITQLVLFSLLRQKFLESSFSDLY